MYSTVNMAASVLTSIICFEPTRGSVKTTRNDTCLQVLMGIAKPEAAGYSEDQHPL